MRKWGIVISLFYAVSVFVFLIPAGMILAGDSRSISLIFSTDMPLMLGEWLSWVPIAAVIAGQGILLFLSVDTSFKKLRPRAHIAVSVTITSMLFALLLFAGLSALWAAINTETFFGKFWTNEVPVFSIWVAIWAAWGILFSFFVRGSAERVTGAISWLLKGSVLELLIAVPCHVWVRRRGDCSAPIATSFGIVTGIAIMLLSFGPGVLLLYKKRLDAYTPPQSN
jgi:hypothetical protein